MEAPCRQERQLAVVDEATEEPRVPNSEFTHWEGGRAQQQQQQVLLQGTLEDLKRLREIAT
jgi:hypothetical protein